MSKKSKPQTATSEPWKAIQPYLLGDSAKGIPGIAPEALNLYRQGGFNTQMQNANNLYMGQLENRYQAPDQFLNAIKGTPINKINNMVLDQAGAAMNGKYDTNFNPVANINQQNVALQQARQGQGPLDPTNAMSRMLSGRPDNPYLRQQANAITGQLTRNLQENVMPGIRSESVLSGQYGGSRQGIAEGLAASRMNQDLAPALTNLFGGAYENAQQRMFGTANALNDQAYQNATNNANRNVGVQQFNANLGLQNNQQQMMQNQNNLNNRMQAVNMGNGLNQFMGGQLQNLGAVNALQDNTYNNAINGMMTPQNINWQNFQNYSNPVLGAAGMGGTQQQTQYKNVGAGALGGAMSGAAMGSMFGPMGTAIGGGLGLLGGLF